MKTRTKVKKVEMANIDFRVWCDHCCIRIAPHEDRTAVGTKAYHPGCYSKLMSSTANVKA
jgi:hypothetical protein